MAVTVEKENRLRTALGLVEERRKELNAVWKNCQRCGAEEPLNYKEFHAERRLMECLNILSKVIEELEWS